MDELLGKCVKALRNAHGLTQEQIADKLGVSRQKYAQIENGSNNITFDILSRVADIFKVKVSDITRFLEQESDFVCKSQKDDKIPAQMIFDMLDLFYANKHLYQRLCSVQEGDALDEI